MYISSKLSLGHLNSVILVIYSLICAVSMATVWLDIIPVGSGNIWQIDLKLRCICLSHWGDKPSVSMVTHLRLNTHTYKKILKSSNCNQQLSVGFFFSSVFNFGIIWGSICGKMEMGISVCVSCLVMRELFVLNYAT